MDFFNGLNVPAEIYVVFQWKSNGYLTGVCDALAQCDTLLFDRPVISKV